MECFGASCIWLIRGLAHTESAERMEAQNSCVVERFLEVLCKRTGPGEAGISLFSPRCNLLSWMLSDSDKLINFS